MNIEKLLQPIYLSAFNKEDKEQDKIQIKEVHFAYASKCGIAQELMPEIAGFGAQIYFQPAVSGSYRLYTYREATFLEKVTSCVRMSRILLVGYSEDGRIITVLPLVNFEEINVG